MQLDIGKLSAIMIVKAIKTRKFLPPKDDLWKLLSENIKFLKENSIVAVTSKVVAIAEGRCIAKDKVVDKDQLIISEADKYIPRHKSYQQLVIQTIKNNMIIASAGIDESNGAGYFILWPKNPAKSAKKIWQFLREKYQVKNLGVILTDSRLIPLRRGVVGISIGYFGFNPLRDYRKTKDIFGREFKMELSNLPDSLASAAVLEMGEGIEQQPFAIIEDIPNLDFIDREWIPSSKDDSFDIVPKEDMFYTLIKSVKWKKGGGGKNQ